MRGRRSTALCVLALVAAGCVAPAGAPDQDVAGPTRERACVGDCLRILADTASSETEASVAIDASDPSRIVVAFLDATWRTRAQPSGAVTVEERSGKIHVASSADGGESWEVSVVPPIDVAPTSAWRLFGWVADPSVHFAPDGTLHLVGLGAVRMTGVATAATPFGGVVAGSGIFAARSADGGRSWSEPTILKYEEFNVAFHDAPKAAVHPETGAMATLWVRWVGPIVARAAIEMVSSFSDDGGRTWSAPTVVARAGRAEAPGFEEGGAFFAPFPVWGRDGALHVAYRGCGDGDGLGYGVASACAKVATTGDRGRSWETVVAAQVTNAKERPLRAWLDHSVMAAAPDGRLWLAYMDASSGDHDVVLSWSDNGAATWEGRVRIHDDPVGNGASQFHPWIDVDAAGILHAFFLDRRNDPENVRIQAAYARYDPATETLVNVLLEEPWHPDPLGDGYDWIGDYPGLAVGGDRVAMAWGRTVYDEGEDPWPHLDAVASVRDIARPGSR